SCRYFPPAIEAKRHQQIRVQLRTPCQDSIYDRTVFRMRGPPEHLSGLGRLRGPVHRKHKPKTPAPH
ncbi:hypothetical protein ACLOJK_031059, partial [Asimina triloba]